MSTATAPAPEAFAAPTLTRVAGADAALAAAGVWQVHALARPGIMDSLLKAAKSSPSGTATSWDLSAILALDHIGAQFFWNVWGGQRPANLKLAPGHEDIFHRLERAGPLAMPEQVRIRSFSKATFQHGLQNISGHFIGFVRLIGQLVLDIGQFLRQPQRGPWTEISANVFHAGFEALGITAIVGILIGVVLSYLSAQQLHLFGADIFLVNILGMSIIRELGPMLAAVLVAGRSGSAITAQLGVMRVTEELDAMLVMGLPHGFRLIMPKVLALALVMPLLVIWTDAMALFGGMMAANFELDLSPVYFMQRLPDAVPAINYWIGLAKGVVFGALIALVACHFGLRIKANTESLGHGTTTSVVSSITIVILADAVFAVVFNGVGYR